MRKYYCLAGSVFLIIAGMVITASSTEMPQFMSGMSTTVGIDVNFSNLYSKANAIYDVIEHDDQHIIWKFADTTGDWAFINKDGTLVIASTSGIDLTIKDKYGDELVDVLSTVKPAEGTVSVNQPVTYYSDNAKVYRSIKQEFDGNFELYLSVPNCSIYQAILSISGRDLADWDQNSRFNGQHYYIDGKEVSGCDIIDRDFSKVPGGISCGGYHSNRMDSGDNWVEVNPVDISENIETGLHTITSNCINNKHTLTIEAISTQSAKPMVLYNKDKSIWVEDTKSQSLDELYALIRPTSNATSTTPQENSTI